MRGLNEERVFYAEDGKPIIYRDGKWVEVAYITKAMSPPALKPGQWALAAVAVTFALLMLFDMVFIIRGGIKDTVSWAIWNLSKNWPAVPFITGFVMGHLFWPKSK